MMFIKRYVVAALALMALVGWYVHEVVSTASVRIDLFGTAFVLPVALWVIFAMFLLLVATVMHMLFASILEEFRLGRYDRDYSQLMTAFADALLRKTGRDHAFRTERYARIGQIVDKSQIAPEQSLAALDEPMVAEIVTLIERLKAGESVDLGKYRLPDANALVQHNALNLYREGKLEPTEVLGSAEKYGEALCREAYRDLMQVATLPTIEKFRRYMHYEALLVMIRRINAPEHTLKVSDATLVEMIDALKDLSPFDLMRLARVGAEHMLPEQRMHVFEKLTERSDKAMEGYLYTLFDLEMVDKARDLLSTTGPEEYQLFKAFADLKTCKKHYDIKIFSSLMK